MSEHDTTATPAAHPRADDVVRAIGRRSFCTLATASAAGRPHVAGVLYAAVGSALYVSTLRSSRKARNLVENPYAHVCVPIRRLPVGPPSTVMFAARADVLGNDDPEVVRLAAAGRLKAITNHGELDLADGCIVRLTPVRRAATYGLGMSLWRLMRDPLNAAGSVDLRDE